MMLSTFATHHEAHTSMWVSKDSCHCRTRWQIAADVRKLLRAYHADALMKTENLITRCKARTPGRNTGITELAVDKLRLNESSKLDFGIVNNRPARQRGPFIIDPVCLADVLGS